MVTGASAGLGRAIACAFAREEGANLGLIARGQERLDSTKREIEALGGRAMVFAVDVADAGGIEAAAGQLEEAFGPIDVWVNNAMVSVFSPVVEMEPEEYHRVTAVTYFGYVHGTLAALRRMRSRDCGTIIQVGSALAYRGIPMQSAYCAAKHAIQGFMDSLRTELIYEGSRIQLCSVHMPALNTPQFRWVKSRLENKAQPVAPIYSPDVGADAVTYISRHPRREMLVGYPTYLAVLGNRVVPGILDQYLGKDGEEPQQIADEPEDPNRPHNLWTAPPGDPGARGVFTDQEKSFSPALWLTKNRVPVLLGISLASVGVLAKVLGRHR